MEKLRITTLSIYRRHYILLTENNERWFSLVLIMSQFAHAHKISDIMIVSDGIQLALCCVAGTYGRPVLTL